MTDLRAGDNELAERFLFGEAAAHTEIDAWITPVVLCRAWTLRDEREDLVQEVKLKLLMIFQAQSFRGHSSLKTFVQAVAKNTCLDAVRRARRREMKPLCEEQLPAPHDNPERRLERRESAQICYEIISRLPGPCRALFRMLFAEEKSYAAISEELGVAIGTVKSRIARCRDRAVQLRRATLRNA